MLALIPSHHVVADLGCGTGHLAAELAPRVARVIAIDNSPQMLKAARKRTSDFANVDLRQGDLESLPIDTGTCDAAMLILVLTFTSSPALELIGSSLWMALVILIIVDSVILVTRLKRGLRRSFPDESQKGVAAYALMRSMQIRRFRLPPPRVRAGRRRRG